MSLKFCALHKVKNETNSHYLIHTTIPTCACSLFLLLFLIALFLNPYSTTYSTIIESNPDAFAMGVPQTKEFTQEILMYLWFGQTIKTEISNQAITHMADVRLLFVVGEIALFALAFAVYFIVRRKTRQQKTRIFTWASASALTTVILSSLLSLIGFEKLFLLFHKLIFSNDLWLFPSNDTLILYFPQYFFQAIATQIVIWLIITTSILLLFCRLAQKQQRLSSSEPAQHI